MENLELSIKIFADGADFDDIKSLIDHPLIEGFTTNPTLMHRAGVRNYTQFARQLLELVPERPVSFEVFADDLPTMEHQARVIASWGSNVIVKIPVINTQGEFTGPIVQRLSEDGIQLNVTALMNVAQVEKVRNVICDKTPTIVSVFAGRVADSGRDPLITMQQSLDILSNLDKTELLWASPREVYNVYQADSIGCHIITLTKGFMEKLNLYNKDLEEFSLETVKMFYQDAIASK